MLRKADFKVETRGGSPAVVLDGDWTSQTLGHAPDRLRAEVGRRPTAAFDISKLGRLDTAGAFALLRATKGELSPELFAERPDSARLIEFIRHEAMTERAAEPQRHAFYDLLVRAGRGLAEWIFDFWESLAFIGRLMATFFMALLNPKRLRMTSVVDLMERAGIDALPVVMITSLGVGAVIAFLGAQLLSQFGASVFAVELIGIAVMREFGVVIMGILLAGRSASSFAAEIGAMKMNQEVDAMQVLGVDPYEALVLPRFLAMVLMSPIMTFASVVAGLAGGLLVTWAVLDLSPAFFLQRIAENVGYSHFLVGMSKAPVLAAVVALIGCRQGLEVGGDVEVLGRRVTAAVVHAIFAIILIDSIFALIYMRLDI